MLGLQENIQKGRLSLRLLRLSQQCETLGSDKSVQLSMFIIFNRRETETHIGKPHVHGLELECAELGPGWSTLGFRLN